MRKTFLKIFSAMTAALFLSCNLSAQEKETIELYKGEIPGSIGNPQAAPDGGTIHWMTSVSRPSLAYYPAENDNGNGTAIVVCPGGGYAGLTYMFEGIETAKWLSSKGIAAFVLKYRLPNDKTMKDRKNGPLQDAQQALRYVRANAKKYGINPSQIGVIGFSAGGHLASTVSTHYNDEVYKSEYNVSARPDFSILIYPVITLDPALTHAGTREALIGKDADQKLTEKFSSDKQVTKDTPPAFLVHALDDNLVPYTNSIMYTDALRKNGVQCELHLYAAGDHGLRVKTPTDTQAFWHEACEKWLRMNNWLK
ncbi:MAG: alpha/beta hydrolase [Bacteroidales bacterium]|nr:alpha/beta hydrolase [Bacteroidales bacterium]MBQ5541155.1 alpha/beta hydrolase [Bacteroidales bacterium]